ncbi:TonB-linked outer membrane protein, SusC/RagA family [Cyclobacterium lianum]|uniref:TonB-linked outer membrane protein, SusC/RagA family n=1 Tax=Cyclobacterium lianum TaxID=388280 RepID=A0A1M7LCP5_9BACT|nr:TonB-dependent receptor [Cyclobacterium lianum]SHM75654.1 TonB-linked outer membrane protein, SusC/RagA family [Cyclobacterium lianum]
MKIPFTFDKGYFKPKISIKMGWYAGLLLLMLSIWSTGAQAQQISVAGNVTDPSGESVPGVNILEKNTSNGTVTDMDGNYELTVSSRDAVLVFSFIGFETQEVSVNGRSEINVVFSEDSQNLEEVVVVGYGTQREKDLTSAITTIKSDDIIKTPNSQAMQALQGRVAGVQIVSNGAPGASPTVRVRGVGSFEGGAAPLYVVDGMFFDNIDFLNPNDIETISVLKDASASAIYGVRAANGVVVIETKSGNYNQEPEIVYDGYYGIQNPQNILKMANTQQFVRYINETGSAPDIAFVRNAIQRYGRSRIDPSLPDVNTDWYAEMMEPASIQNHTLTFNGGNERTRYSVGGSYFDQQGLMKDTRNSYKRMNFRIKLDTDLKDWISVGGNLNVSTAEQYNGDNGAWFRSYFAVPIIPVYDEQNTDAQPYQLSNAQQIGYRGNQNPFYSLFYSDNRNKIAKILGNFYAELEIIPNNLTFKTSYNYNLESVNGRSVGFAYNDGVTERQSSISRRTFNRFDQIWDNFLTYQNNFDRHNLTVVLGQSYRSETNESLFARGENINPNPDRDEEQFWYLNNATDFDLNGIGDGGSRLFFQSYFSRVAYNFDDRYLLYGTFRRDGNNKFQKKWGNFATFGAGWVLTEEAFFDVDAVNFLKLRGSWGQLGNDGISPSVGAPVLVENNAAINGVLVIGRRLDPTFDLIAQWETTVERNFGMNARLFRDRLSLEADYFIRDTRNLAVSIIPPVIRASERRSVGEIRNQGVEVAANWEDNLTTNFSYYIGGNFGTLKNTVLDLGGAEGLDAGSAEFRQRSIIGQPYQAFFGYETDGVFQSQEQINSYGYSQEFINDNDLQPGDLIFRDQNGDGVVNDQDRVVLGSFLPSLTYGFNVGFRYKNLDFSALFQGQSGYKILNRKRGEIIFTNDTNIDAELANNLWRGEGTSDRYPSAAGLRKGWNQNLSDYFVEDGSYFRIQNVRLAYTLADKEVFGTQMPETRITLTAERPLTMFNYNGFNPEVANGIDRQVYPIPAIYTVGLNIKL